ALTELGRPAAIVVSVAILFIVIIALAGLGIVVVKALGGEDLKLPNGTSILLADYTKAPDADLREPGRYRIPAGSKIIYPNQSAEAAAEWGEAFGIQLPAGQGLPSGHIVGLEKFSRQVELPSGTQLLIPGSSWGLFTIACT